ncbi:CD109 antigen-like [Pelodytes ibericus]
MQLHGAPPVRNLILLISFLHMSEAWLAYHITTPSYITAGVNTTLAVHMFDASYTEMNLTADILLHNTVLVSASRVFYNDSVELFTLPAIPEDSSSEYYNLRVCGSVQNESSFYKHITLPLKKNDISVFIQTDKFTYKPGQTVKIRVISIYPDKRPYKGNVELGVMDPKQNIVQKWQNLNTVLGVVSTEFLLSSNLILGTWMIQAVADDIYTSVNFSIAEYDVPKFYVMINVPAVYNMKKMQNLTGTVTAKDIFGKSIRGNVTLSIKQLDYYSYRDINQTHEIESGSANFSFTYHEIYYWYWRTIQITATVTEELTGIVSYASSYVKIVYSEYRIIMVSEPQVPEQGLNFTTKMTFNQTEAQFQLLKMAFEWYAYKTQLKSDAKSFKIQLLKMNNDPLTEEERDHNITIRIYQYSYYWWNRLQRRSINDSATFPTPVHTNDSATVSATVDTNGSATFPATVDTNDSVTSFTPGYTTTGSDLWNVEKQYTISESGIVNIEFSDRHHRKAAQAAAFWRSSDGGASTEEEKKMPAEYQDASQTWYLNNNYYYYYYYYYETCNQAKIRISNSTKEIGEEFQVKVNTWKKPQDLYYVIIAKGIIVAAGKKSSLIFTLTPEQSWAPSATLIVYLVTPDCAYSNIYKTSEIFYIKDTFKNTVSLTWGKTNLQPAENISLTVRVRESHSLVGLNVVEKGLTQENINDLTGKRVEDRLIESTQHCMTIPTESPQNTLCSLRQGKRPIEDFVTEFFQAAVETSWSETTPFDKFCLGLSDTLKHELALVGVHPNLYALVDLSIQIDRIQKSPCKLVSSEVLFLPVIQSMTVLRGSLPPDVSCYLHRSGERKKIRGGQRNIGNSLSDFSIWYDDYPFDEFIPGDREDETFEQPELIRTFYPETWLWVDINISSGVTTSLEVTTPQKNSTWVATAFVMSEEFGLGLTEVPAELHITKPFFISLNLPYSVIRGEQFILEVTLFNNLEDILEVIVALNASNSYEVIIPNTGGNTVAGKTQVTVPRLDGKTVLFPINPKQLGQISITVTATSTVASDIVTENIFVKAEGVKHFYSEAAIFEVNGGSVLKKFSFSFPPDLVQGSEEAFVTVIGDLLGPSIDGLESLIQMPYGCGEQNMINFAPNIYVLQYLITTRQIKENIRAQAISFMEKGYQAELTYKRDDGSFSAFGNSDSSGSTWLSAFVFRCFLQARPFIYINQQVLNQMVEWLVQYQDVSTGIFSEPGHVIHTELQGGLNGPITLTAYILTSLLEDEEYRNALFSVLHGFTSRSVGFCSVGVIMFTSHDTIMALQALAQFITVAPGGETSLTMTVTGPDPFVPKSFHINSGNLLVLQSQLISVFKPLSIEVSADGNGLAIFQLNIIYNQKASSRRKRNALIPEAFSLEVMVKEDKHNTQQLSVDVCTSYEGAGNESGMALLDIGFLSGFTLGKEGIPTTGSLKMVEKKDDKVYLYFDSVNKTEQCVSVPMVRAANVAGSQDSVITILEYYNPGNSATRTYNSETMKEISSCDFCGVDCALCKSNVKPQTSALVKPQTSNATSSTFHLLRLMVFTIYYIIYV